MKRVLILGVNGFIGHHLSQEILETTDWEIFGMDMQTDRITDLLAEPRFHFFEGDITINREWIEYHIKKCDTVLPLVAIATPATYVREPLRVFELDFEANLPIVRACVRYKQARRLSVDVRSLRNVARCRIRPRASELVLGPINKPRWIYSCAKQLMDRVIHAYGMQEGLDYTLFRPFNWIGAGLDSINTAKEGSSRVITQFLGHIVRGEPIKLVDGGTQKRAFTYIDDGINALMKIIANKERHRHRARSTTSAIRPTTGRCASWRKMMLALAKRLPGVCGQRRPREDRRDHGRVLLRRGLPGRAEPRAQDHQHLRRSRLETGGGDGRCAAAHPRRYRAWTRRARRLARIFDAYSLGRSPKGGGELVEEQATLPFALLQATMRLALKIDVDTRCAARAKGVPNLVHDCCASTASPPRSCSRSAPTTPDGRSSACSVRALYGKVRRTSVVKHYGVTHAAVRDAAARPGHRPPRGRRDAGPCAMPATRPASIAGTTSAGRTAWARPTPSGRCTRCDRACERFTEIFGAAVARTARPAGR